MRARTGHIIFKKNINYIDLAPVYQGLLTEFLEETNQMPEENDRLYMHIRLGLMDLENNRKPEGFRWNNRQKLLFPLRYCEPGEYCQPVELYVITGRRSFEIIKITESLSKFLTNNDIEYDISWDDFQRRKENGFKPLHSFECPKRSRHTHHYPPSYNGGYRSNIKPISVRIKKSRGVNVKKTVKKPSKKVKITPPKVRHLGKTLRTVHDYIKGNPGEIQKDIAETLGISTQCVYQKIKRLLSLDLVRIEEDDEDRRQRRIY